MGAAPLAHSSFDDLLSSVYRFLDIDPHGRRTAWLAFKLAKVLGLDRERIGTVISAAATHDIGKLLVPALIREKRGKLSSREMVIMRHHTLLGRDLLEGMHKQRGDRADFAAQAEIALLHHERWDGCGYPFRLKREEIRLEARIVAVADTFDSLTAARGYKAAWPIATAIELIYSERTLQFDPTCVDAFALLEAELLGGWAKLSADIEQGISTLPRELADWSEWLTPHNKNC
jgi:putative two-component system response regulator